MKKLFIFLTIIFLINSQPLDASNKFRGVVAGLFLIVSGVQLWHSIFSISMKTNCDATKNSLWGFSGCGYNATSTLKRLANNLSYNVCDGSLDTLGFCLPVILLGLFCIMHLEMKRLENRVESRERLLKSFQERRSNTGPSNPEQKEIKMVAIDMPD